MDIGKEGKPYVIEPLVEPVPGRSTPAPSEPDYGRPEADPVVPVFEPEKVPA